MIKSLGWTVVDLFRVTESNDLALVTGFFKVPLKHTPMPDPSKVLLQAPSTTESEDIMLHLRIAHGDMINVVSQFAVDPDVHAGMRYQLSKPKRLLFIPNMLVSSLGYYHLSQDRESSSPPKVLNASLRRPSVGSITDQMMSKNVNDTAPLSSQSKQEPELSECE